jgi:serine/threonine protein kinase
VVVAARVKNINSLADGGDDSQALDENHDMSDEGVDESAHEMVAIKKIMLQGFTAGMIRRTLRELKILRLLQHENCLTLLSVLPPPSREEFKEIYLVTNLMPTNLH